jgi:hypothetical protein
MNCYSFLGANTRGMTDIIGHKGIREYEGELLCTKFSVFTLYIF